MKLSGLSVAVVATRALLTGALHLREQENTALAVAEFPWIVPRTGDNPALFQMHISKAAGSSYARDIERMLPAGMGFWTCEQVLSSVVQNRDRLGDDDRIVTMIRDPVSHVYSQYLECAFDTDWTGRISPEHVNETYLLDNVSSWLHHFTDNGFTSNDLGCYNPYNYQTRAFVARFGTDIKHQWNMGEPATVMAERAVERMREHVWFVGIVEFYHESLCVLFDRLHGRLPRHCGCGDLADADDTHQTHHVPEHDVSDLSKDDLRRVHTLTEADRILYDAAVADFKQEVASVEKRHGVKIMCRD